VRILGILQRMSICYGIVLLIHGVTDYGTHELKRRVAGFIMLAFLIVYVSLMLSWEDPSIGCYRSNNLDPYCNFAGYVDRAVFTEAHIMEKTDPEGLISTLTASFTTYVGYCFGLMLLKYKKHLDTLIKYWLVVAFICLLAIYPCSLFMPFNKRLYTLTFLFAVLSSSATILTFLLLIIDYYPKVVNKPSKIISTIIQPFTWLGLNPLAVFIVLQLMFDVLTNWITVNDSTPYQIFYDACFSWMSPGIGTSIYALFYGIIYTIIAGLLFKFKIFIRL
jgi:predicted acyltransferase